MKIVEQTSNCLTLKDSAVAAWGMRLFSTPFLLFGCVGVFIVITEQVLPSLFIIFCLVVGIVGVFFTAHQTIWIDKSQNSFIIQTTRLFFSQRLRFTCNEVNTIVKETPFRTKKYSGLKRKSRSIYVVVLEIASHPYKIQLSGNNSFTRNEAIELADLIRSFLSAPE